MIRLLYEASQAGVEIQLIIRGICCLRPGIAGDQRSHSGDQRHWPLSGAFPHLLLPQRRHEEYYIGSADWMTRNLDRRVEAVTPIEAPKLTKELQDILDIMLADNRQAWDMNSEGVFTQRRPAKGEAERGTHKMLMEYYLKRTRG
jgi:polyphosphate kinase